MFYVNLVEISEPKIIQETQMIKEKGMKALLLQKVVKPQRETAREETKDLQDIITRMAIGSLTYKLVL